jgi:serine/threonine protein kinase
VSVEPLSKDDPRRIGPFRLEGRLGSGGMGEVFLGRSKRNGRAAVKLLRRDLSTDPQFRARFRREVQLALRVTGVCTAQLVDADVDADRPWLATEFVDGPTLLGYVREHGPLPPDQLTALALGLLEALHAIHAAGVVHRDLTPGNVLLAPTGPKVVDFGIAHTADGTAVTLTGGVMGTPAWMAPKQIRGDRPTAATDIFAWGLVVAYAGLGRSAFGEGRPEVLLHRIVNDAPETEGLPEPVRAAVSRCLDKDPSKRPSVEDLVERLADRDAVTQLDAFTQEILHSSYDRTSERRGLKGCQSVYPMGAVYREWVPVSDTGQGTTHGDGGIRWPTRAQAQQRVAPHRHRRFVASRSGNRTERHGAHAHHVDWREAEDEEGEGSPGNTRRQRPH